ncbi:BON domain-containing protein [Paraburkholderia sp. 1N]|uniref:BON domain-containing protein n=1 Tax=Paraburkholderia solitsugae TaxID=2675748 RepID=A0ABX2BVT0_9BURK|nr:BON domain-containing protein [Paraburkholderia solitsugae]NPT43905.1 BON domain-containing protein [Paraburkholderia solitsugae]
MKVIRTFQTLGVVLSLALVSSVHAQSQSSAPTVTPDSAASAKATQMSIRKADRKLGSDVRRALSKTKDIEVTNIFVRARGGAVTLTGSVPDNAQIDRAAEVARSVPGVTSVTNKLSLQAQNF